MTRRASRPEHDRRAVVSVAAWCAVVAASAGITAGLRAAGVGTWIGAPPLFGRFRFAVDGYLLVVAVLGGALVHWGPKVAARARWTHLLFFVAASSALFAVALALVGDGLDGLVRPVTKPSEYLPQLGVVGNDPLRFVADFVGHVEDGGLRVHAAGHPPGPLLVLWGLDRMGLGGEASVATAFVLGGAAAMPAILIAVRNVVDERAARAAAPFLVVVPAVIWLAVSADALFAGVTAWAVTLFVLATGRRGRASDVLAGAGGLCFGLAAMLSYGVVLAAVIPVVLAVARRRARPIVVATLGAATVFGAAAVAGFWWFDGLGATHARYADGISASRPYVAFLVANLGALALVVGPAVAVGLGRLRGPTWLLVGGALGAIALADLSGLSKAETERIWLPFALWLLPATWVLARDERSAQRWLSVQLATTVLLQTAVRTGW
jgi:hypothetical protein